MNIEKKQQLIKQLQSIRFDSDNAKRIVIAATSGEIEVQNPQLINNVLDYLLKELRIYISKDLENE